MCLCVCVCARERERERARERESERERERARDKKLSGSNGNDSRKYSPSLTHTLSALTHSTRSVAVAIPLHAIRCQLVSILKYNNIWFCAMCYQRRRVATTVQLVSPAKIPSVNSFKQCNATATGIFLWGQKLSSSSAAPFVSHRKCLVSSSLIKRNATATRFAPMDINCAQELPLRYYLL